MNEYTRETINEIILGVQNTMVAIKKLLDFFTRNNEEYTVKRPANKNSASSINSSKWNNGNNPVTQNDVRMDYEGQVANAQGANQNGKTDQKKSKYEPYPLAPRRTVKRMGRR